MLKSRHASPTTFKMHTIQTKTTFTYTSLRRRSHNSTITSRILRGGQLGKTVLDRFASKTQENTTTKSI